MIITDGDDEITFISSTAIKAAIEKGESEVREKAEFLMYPLSTCITNIYIRI